MLNRPQLQTPLLSDDDARAEDFNKWVAIDVDGEWHNFKEIGIHTYIAEYLGNEQELNAYLETLPIADRPTKEALYKRMNSDMQKALLIRDLKAFSTALGQPDRFITFNTLYELDILTCSKRIAERKNWERGLDGIDSLAQKSEFWLFSFLRFSSLFPPCAILLPFGPRMPSASFHVNTYLYALILINGLFLMLEHNFYFHWKENKQITATESKLSEFYARYYHQRSTFCKEQNLIAHDNEQKESSNDGLLLTLISRVNLLNRLEIFIYYFWILSPILTALIHRYLSYQRYLQLDTESPCIGSEFYSLVTYKQSFDSNACKQPFDYFHENLNVTRSCVDFYLTVCSICTFLPNAWPYTVTCEEKQFIDIAMYAHILVSALRLLGLTAVIMLWTNNKIIQRLEVNASQPPSQFLISTLISPNPHRHVSNLRLASNSMLNNLHNMFISATQTQPEEEKKEEENFDARLGI